MEEKIQSPDPDWARLEDAPGPVEIATLTRRMTAGDDMAWRVFHDNYLDRLWRYLLVATNGNEELAGESLQSALIRVARHIKVFHDEKVFWSWLTVLARTALADERKKQRRYFSFLECFMRSTPVQEERATDADERLNNLLQRHLASLSPDEKHLIEQKYFNSRAVRDLAVELGTSEKAVESKLSRIRQKLKDAVLKELGNET